MFVPLEITFKVSNPVVAQPYINFDSLVMHLQLRRVMGINYRCLPSKRVVKEACECKIPIKKTGEIYNASVSIFDNNRVYVTTIHKRFYEKGLNLNKIKRKKIDKSRGKFKDYVINIPYRPVRKVTFYVNGDPVELEYLLQALPALGKHSDIGFGMISDFKIKEIKKDWSIVKKGIAMRPIPAEMLESFSELRLLAYKPPYWAKESLKMCAPPFSAVKLKVVE